MRKLSKAIPVLFLLAGVFCVQAQVTFKGLDLNRTGTLLFSAETDSPRFGTYSVLFSSRLGDRSLSQLTWYPEEIRLLAGTEQLQIQNRFGVFRTAEHFGRPELMDTFPSFVNGGDIGVGKTPAMEVSPDGKYLLFLRPRSAGYADLILLDLVSGSETLISSKMELHYDDQGLLWSPDSRFFVYARGENIYYFSIRQLSEERILPEEYRSLGSGGLENVRWTEGGDLYYINRHLVYRILSAEFFTRSLYQNLLGRGTLVGKLPFVFDPNFDSFWLSPDGAKLLLDKGGQNLFLYYMKNSDYLSTGEIINLPYLYLPRNTRVTRVLWSPEDLISLFTRSIEGGETRTRVYRLNLATFQTSPGYTAMPDQGIRDIRLSPDGSLAAVMMDNRVVIRDYKSWRQVMVHSHPEPLHLLWLDGSRMIIAGGRYTETWDMTSDKSTLVALSQADSYGFDAKTGAVVMESAGKAYTYGEAGWTPAEKGDYSPAGVSSPQYRVYLDSCFDRSYTNQVMIRKVEELGTVPLFDLPETVYAPFPEKEDPRDPYFSHGSRLRRREVALVFNAVDNSDGLTETLMTLSEYGLKCTFFLNGDFIRQNPEAAQEIARSGHEVGSLFHTNFNLTDSRFVVDQEFIKRGLARNEDDYFTATGRELSLFWHAPYYVVNSDVLAASREMNYVYIGRDVDPLDWALADPSTGRTVSLTAPEMVERIIGLKKPGSIIPVQLGINDQRSGGYLYNNLEILLNALMKEGYTVVPVSTLMAHMN